MKKIGILGGLAWPSTAEYYAHICRLVEQRHATAGLDGVPVMPEMVVESLNVARAVALLGNDDNEASWSAFDAYHRAGLLRLQRSGADFAIIACNTAHHRFAQITDGLAIPVLSMLDVAARACLLTGVKRLLILGTEPVMRSDTFRQAFAEHGIKAMAPYRLPDRRRIIRTIRALQAGHIQGMARQINSVASALVGNATSEPSAAYLGCTELPLAFPAHQRTGVFECGGVRYINSTSLHARAAFDYAISDKPPTTLDGSSRAGPVRTAQRTASIEPRQLYRQPGMSGRRPASSSAASRAPFLAAPSPKPH